MNYTKVLNGDELLYSTEQEQLYSITEQRSTRVLNRNEIYTILHKRDKLYSIVDYKTKKKKLKDFMKCIRL